MPELPEVEVTRLALLPHLPGRKVTSLRRSPDKLRHSPPSIELAEKLIDKVVTTINRRAKYLLFSFNNGVILIIHLGMTGRLGIFPTGTPAAKHDHFALGFDDGMEMRLNDTRRFGSLYLMDSITALNLEKTFFSNTGPEPFSPTCSAKYMKDKAKGTSQGVKPFIMNSTIIAGVGNIYANESLFHARIHPETAASALSLNMWQRLLESILIILRWAIDCGGSTISDFLSGSGQSGYFQANFKVYGRENLPCTNCLSQGIKKRVTSGRATFFCPKCQRKYYPRRTICR